MGYHEYVAIEGVIGVGKTTLARMLAEDLKSELLLEVFEENPFLGDFYADRARYAFQTQMFFLVSRYHQQHRIIPPTLNQNRLVSDYFFDKDKLFAHLNLAHDELAMYDRVHAILDEQIPVPDSCSICGRIQTFSCNGSLYETGHTNETWIEIISRPFDRPMKLF